MYRFDDDGNKVPLTYEGVSPIFINELSMEEKDAKEARRRRLLRTATIKNGQWKCKRCNTVNDVTDNPKIVVCEQCEHDYYTYPPKRKS